MTIKIGGGFPIVTLIFIILKLTGNITWSWLWVLCPLWLGFAFVLTLVTLFGILLVGSVAFNGLPKLVIKEKKYGRSK